MNNRCCCINHVKTTFTCQPLLITALDGLANASVTGKSRTSSWISPLALMWWHNRWFDVILGNQQSDVLPSWLLTPEGDMRGCLNPVLYLTSTTKVSQAWHESHFWSLEPPSVEMRAWRDMTVNPAQTHRCSFHRILSHFIPSTCWTGSQRGLIRGSSGALLRDNSQVLSKYLCLLPFRSTVPTLDTLPFDKY